MKIDIIVFFILVFIGDQAISLITENKLPVGRAWMCPGQTAQENIESGIISQQNRQSNFLLKEWLIIIIMKAPSIL